MVSAHHTIVYTSIHHGNTRKVAEAMASELDARIVEPGEEARDAVRASALAGFGSGIFFGSHHRSLLDFAESLQQARGTPAFIFSTSGTGYRIPRLVGIDYHRTLRRILRRKGYTIAGEFHCKGFDIYGPWGRLGGISKGRPNQADLNEAREFARILLTGS